MGGFAEVKEVFVDTSCVLHCFKRSAPMVSEEMSSEEKSFLFSMNLHFLRVSVVKKNAIGTRGSRR
jgi:hypothetical protein